MFSQASISQFLTELHTFQMSWNDLDGVKKSTKADHSPVTEIDHALSEFFKHHPLAKGHHFFSEEDHGELRFPALILDPLDGTRDFIAGRPECAISAAWMATPELTSESFALIQNPFSGFTLTSFSAPAWRPRPQQPPYDGLVSRSEWESGLYAKFHSTTYLLRPRGSIAFKLGLLASGACDYVVSRRPKNIWDIAAGTLLLQQRGFQLYSAGQQVTQLDRTKYPAPLIWASPELMPALLGQFSP